MNTQILSVLLNDSNCSLPQILSYLSADDIESLYIATINTVSNEDSTRLMFNCIHYNRYMSFDHSFNLTWGYHPDNCFADSISYGSRIVRASNLNLIENKYRADQLRNMLTSTLQKFIGEDQPETTNPIVEDIFQCFKEGQLLVPRLRRECIGMNSNSPLQYYLADQLTQEQPEPNEECIYQPLRNAVYSQEPEIIDATIMMKPLLQRRFQSELTVQYTESESSFVNLIDLIILAADAHVETVYALLKAEHQPVERMIYFVSHYINYRQSMLCLNDKLGFLFEEFDHIFDSAHPECQSDEFPNPPFSLVNIMLKKWINRFKEFHEEFSHLFCYMMMSLRQRTLSNEVFNNSQAMFSNEFNLSAMKAQPFTSFLSSHASYTKDTNFSELSKHPEAIKHIVYHYTEYLVDMSVNSVSVHWNDHSEQDIGKIYLHAEKIVISDTLKFYSHIYKSVHDLSALKHLIETDLSVLKAQVKPVTVKKIVSLANQLLNNIKESVLCSDSHQQQHKISQQIKDSFEVDVNFSKGNTMIETMTENMRIPSSIPLEQIDLYDLTKTVDLKQLTMNFELTDSQIDRAELESYISEGEDDGVQEVDGVQEMQIEEPNSEGQKYEQLSTAEISVESNLQDTSSHLDKGKRPRQNSWEVHQPLKSMKKMKR